MKQVQPVGKFILLKSTKVSETRGGIILPGTADKQIMIVVDVGDAVAKISEAGIERPRFSKGDEVVLHIPQVITLNSDEVEKGLVLVHEDQVCCKLTSINGSNNN